MPPKIRVTKEEILEAAFSLVREEGEGALNARTLATCLKCSTQPLFSNFSSMQELRLAVVKMADELCDEFIREEQAKGKYPAYKAAGMAYIRFAKEERELFQLLYMRDRSEEGEPSALQMKESMASLVTQATGLAGDERNLFHLEMWAYVHGIAAMLATGFLELEEDLIATMITDCYQGLRKRHKGEE